MIETAWNGVKNRNEGETASKRNQRKERRERERGRRTIRIRDERETDGAERSESESYEMRLTALCANRTCRHPKRAFVEHKETQGYLEKHQQWEWVGESSHIVLLVIGNPGLRQATAKATTTHKQMSELGTKANTIKQSNMAYAIS